MSIVSAVVQEHILTTSPCFTCYIAIFFGVQSNLWVLIKAQLIYQ